MFDGTVLHHRRVHTNETFAWRSGRASQIKIDIVFLHKSERGDSHSERSASEIPLQCDNSPRNNLHLFARAVILNVPSINIQFTHCN